MTIKDELYKCATSVAKGLGAVKEKRSRDEQMNACSEVVTRMLGDSSLCVIGGIVHYFDGEVYEAVPDMEYRSALNIVLNDFGVPPIVSRMMPSFSLPFLMERKVSPRNTLIAFTNGILDIATGELHPFSHTLPCTYRLPYAYDADAACPLWDHFLTDVLPIDSERLRLQEFLGMVYIDREVTKIDKALILIGEGANGKSVVYNVVKALVGPEYVASLSPRQLCDDRRIINLVGKKLNYCSEVRASDTMTSALKALISAEPVAAWGLYKGVSYVTCPPIIFTMNQYPHIDDRTYGFFRRMLPIRFDVTIPPALQNKELANTIISRELPGIFQWVMQGRRRLLAQKGEFTHSEVCEEEIARMEEESSPVLQYMRENGFSAKPRFRGQEGMRIKASELFEGMTPREARSASRELLIKGFRKVKCSAVYYIVYPEEEA